MFPFLLRCKINARHSNLIVKFELENDGNFTKSPQKDLEGAGMHKNLSKKALPGLTCRKFAQQLRSLGCSVIL